MEHTKQRTLHFNDLRAFTMPEIVKSLHVNAALQHVLYEAAD